MKTSTIVLVVVGGVVVVAALYLITQPREPISSFGVGGGTGTGGAADSVSLIGGSLTGFAAGIAGAIEQSNSGAVS